MFRTNLAKVKLVFTDGHAYYNGLPLLAKKQAEAMVIDPNFSAKLQGKKGGYVHIHAKADANKKQQHVEAAQVLADKGNQIKLMPEIHIKDVANRKLFFPELIGNSNPDARFNGILGDFKIPDSKTITYDIATRCITETAKKNVSICAISLLEKEYKLNDVLSGIKGALKNENYNKSIKEVWIILKDKSILKIPRGVINNKDFYKIARSL